MEMSHPEFVHERTTGIMGKDSKGNTKYFEKASSWTHLLKQVEAESQDRGFLFIFKCSIMRRGKYVIK